MLLLNNRHRDARAFVGEGAEIEHRQGVGGKGIAEQARRLAERFDRILDQLCIIPIAFLKRQAGGQLLHLGLQAGQDRFAAQQGQLGVQQQGVEAILQALTGVPFRPAGGEPRRSTREVVAALRRLTG